MATVLLVDDDEDLIEANRLVLNIRGHEVLAARSAAEARELLKARQPDVAVLDIMMETDEIGFELAREIHDQFPSLPTIVLSSIHGTKKPGFRFGPDETWLPVLKFLDKPVDPKALADEIDQVLGKA